jgi:hypothetical protein
MMERGSMLGLDDLGKQCDEATRAADKLSGLVGILKFNPADPTEVKKAISQIEGTIDAKLSRYRNNPLVRGLAETTKARVREEIQKIARDASQTK